MKRQRTSARGGALLVASTGGHLSELHQLRRDVMARSDRVRWVTFDSVQSRSLLAEEGFEQLDEIGSRGYASLIKGIPEAFRIMARVRPDRVVSTGAGVALAFLPFAFLFRARAVYVESAARTDGPSFTGRLLSFLPWIHVYTQWEHQAVGRWRFRYSVFKAAGNHPAPAPVTDPQGAQVLVMLGTSDFPFTRLVERIQEVAPPGMTVRWQLGSTEADGVDGHELLPVDELVDLARSSTMVISHAGVGSALLALNAGVRPVLVPRRVDFGEHIDDHQVQVARELGGQGAAYAHEVDELTTEMFGLDYRVVGERDLNLAESAPAPLR